MELGYKQIVPLVFGAARIEEQAGKICVNRFTRAQSEAYERRNTDLYNRTLATAGIRLEFITDSEHFGLAVAVKHAAARTYFSHEVYVNDVYRGCLAEENFQEDAVYRKTFALGEGTKKVCCHFPWSACSQIVSVTLDDGASVTPVTKSKKLILFGDSITHGYEAVHTAHTYATLLTDMLDADGVNKAIGGERFFAELAALRDDFDPDYITVAYGTNDWSGGRAAEDTECAAFYGALSRLYPEAKIFALLPIWRADEEAGYNKKQSFREFAAALKETAQTFPNVTVIDCYDFVPHEGRYYFDLRLHPNDLGFAFYSKRLRDAILKTQ